MSVAVSSAFVRPADIDGVPSVEWVMARYRREWQGAKSDRQPVSAVASACARTSVTGSAMVESISATHNGRTSGP